MGKRNEVAEVPSETPTVMSAKEYVCLFSASFCFLSFKSVKVKILSKFQSPIILQEASLKTQFRANF